MSLLVFPEGNKSHKLFKELKAAGNVINATLSITIIKNPSILTSDSFVSLNTLAHKCLHTDSKLNRLKSDFKQ